MTQFIDPVFERYYRDHPIVLVDVGARGGVHDRWRRIGRHLEIVAFEPDPRSADVDSTGFADFSFVPVALSNVSDDAAELYLTRNPVKSSLLEPDLNIVRGFGGWQAYEVVEKTTLQVDRLDAHLNQTPRQYCDFMKVDVQGGELAVLEGAANALEHGMLGLEVEINFIQRYKNLPCFWEIDRHLGSLGFSVFDLERRFWRRELGGTDRSRKGQISHGNALYFRRIESLREILNAVDDESRAKAMILKLATLSLVYGFRDYAAAVLREFADRFDEGERTALSRFQREAAKPSGLPMFPGRDRLARLLFLLYRMFRTTAGDRTIGNP